MNVCTRIKYEDKNLFRKLMNTNYSHDSTPSNNTKKKARCFTCKSDFRQIKICLNPIISNAIFLRYHQNKPTSIHQQTLISSSKQRNNTPITPNDPSTPQISTNNPICTYKATTFYYKSAIFKISKQNILDIISNNLTFLSVYIYYFLYNFLCFSKSLFIFAPGKQ